MVSFGEGSTTCLCGPDQKGTLQRQEVVGTNRRRLLTEGVVHSGAGLRKSLLLKRWNPTLSVLVLDLTVLLFGFNLRVLL
jgi:hypothetical protein